MPTLFKRSNGFYYAILTDAQGRRKWISTKESTYRLALKKLVQLGNVQEESIPRVMLRSFYDDFKTYARRIYSPETVVVYDRAFTRFLEHCGNRNLESISARRIDTFKAKRLQDVSPVTVNIEMRTLDLHSIRHCTGN